MALRDWLQPPRSVLTLYLAGAAAALAAMTWLAVLQLASDEFAEARRAEQRLEAAAGRVAVRLDSSLRQLRNALSGTTPLPDGAVVIRTDGDGVRVEHGALPYLPIAPRDDDFDPAVFEAAEELEFGGGDLPAAARTYQRLARISTDKTVRARALLAAARTLSNAGRLADAVDVASGVIDDPALNGVIIEGRPAEVLARLARCRALGRLGDRARFDGDAAELRDGLAAGRWPLAGPAWHAVYASVVEWSGTTPASPGIDRGLALAAAAERFWQDEEARTAHTAAIVDNEMGAALFLHSGDPDPRTIIVDAEWMASWWQAVVDDAAIRVALIDRSGDLVLGRALPRAVPLEANETGLPWTIAVADADPGLARRQAAARRRTFLAGLLLVGLVIGGSGVLTFRGIRREMAVARMHADFVASASHEFRTPVTSIRQLSHLLMTHPVDDRRRARYYEVLARESERLHRLVERLLTFGRADAGRVRPERLDARDLAAAVADEFATSSGHDVVDLRPSAQACPVDADRELLALALWNLLDNAVKYSPPGARVQVDVEAVASEVRLSVKDAGCGIAPEDRRRVFQQFVRGPHAALAAPGSGLGLALVDRVVRAHAGRIDLESGAGAGSVFTIVLPMGRPS